MRVRDFRNRVLFIGVLALSLFASSSFAQHLEDDMVGQNEKAWVDWKAAMKSVDRNERDAAATLLTTLSQGDLTDLRLALMADRTGTNRLEAWAATVDVPADVKALVERIANGRKQRALAEDGWHLAAIGRFKMADAHFKALDETNPDPVALLELARANPNRHDILLKLINNADVGPSAARFLEILAQGEEMLRTDPYEIVANIEKLAGSPRMVYNATNRLKSSGEYAIPHLIRALQNSSKVHLHAAIIQVIPRIGLGGLNPLCQAFGIEDDVTKRILIDAAVQIGYKQAVPYLAKLAADSRQSGEIRAAATQAMSSLGVSSSDVSGLFLELAGLYFDDTESLQADPRRDSANIWYLSGGELNYVPVPRAIFNDIMAMRSSEQSLLANPDAEQATAIWLASNYRREAKLGLDVESDQPDPLTAKDSTRPGNYPRSIYFGRAAGARYNHMVLSRAVNNREAGIALGAIAALRDTAGGPGLVGNENFKQALVQALSFPNRQVRFKAAEAIALALPKMGFSGAENVVPVLAEALQQSGRQGALIVDPNEQIRTKFQTLLRSIDYECALGANLYDAMQNARNAGMASFDLVLLASDAGQPGAAASIAELRKGFETAATPILIIAKEDDTTRANRLARSNEGVEMLPSDVIDMGDVALITRQVNSRIGRASRSLGMGSLDRDLSMQLALRSADAVRAISASGSSVLDASRATPALIAALQGPSERLRIRAAHALALAGGLQAQEAIAESALDANHQQAERIAAFGSLAESARRNGNLLGDREVVTRLIELTKNEQDLVLRAAASKALGALDLPGDQASDIIRAQQRG